jgi:hypothetical protein
MPQDADWRCCFHQNRKQPCLIREYYGSLAIRVAQLKGGRAETPASRTPLPDGIGSQEGLRPIGHDLGHKPFVPQGKRG